MSILLNSSGLPFLTAAGVVLTGSVTATGHTASMSISQTNLSELVAPATVLLEATSHADFDVSGPGGGEVYDPLFHEVTHIWDLDDASNSTPFVTGLNVPTAWENMNIAYGRYVVHTFNDPGTYTVSCWAIDATGNTALETVEITVADPDTEYTTTRTAVFAADSDFTGKPTGATECETISEVVTFIEGLTSPGRVLFKRGEEVDDVNFTFGSSVNQNIHIGAWGSGDRPILNVTKDSIFLHVNDATATKYTCHDLDIQGTWDASAEVGYVGCALIDVLDCAVSNNAIFHRCNIEGISGSNHGSNGATYDARLIFSECACTDWKGYFVLQGQPGKSASGIYVIGTSIAQNPSACQGIEPTTTTLHNSYGPIRHSGAKHVYFRLADFFSRCGNNPSGLGSGEIPAVQPCLRINADASAGVEGIGDRMICEGGFSIMVITEAADSGTKTPGNYYFDKLLMLASPQTRNFINWAHGGVSIRNGYFFCPSMTLQTGGVPDFIDARFNDVNAGTGNLAAGGRYYNTTFLNLLTAAQNVGDGSVSIQRGFTDFTTAVQDNYVHHAPDQSSAVTTYAPIDTSTTLPGVVPRASAGIRASLEKPTATSGTGTATLSYPSGTSQSNTWGSKSVAIVGGAYYYEQDGDFTVTHGASNISLSGGGWASGLAVTYSAHLIDYTDDSTRVSPSTIPLPRPQSGSPALDDGDDTYKAHDDFLMDVRPRSGGGTNWDDSTIPTGTPERGAFQAA